MKRIIIIGAGGHGKVVADIARNNEYDEILFLDDNPNINKCYNYAIVGNISDAKSYKEYDFVIAIGNSEVRKSVQEKLENEGLNIVSLIHPNAVIGEYIKIEKGTVVMAGAVINPNTIIGKGCIINTCSSVDHDCNIGDFSHIAVGAHIAGTVNIGKETFIGAGATIINNINICNGCWIGAGAVVVDNIEKMGVYIGIPAKLK